MLDGTYFFQLGNIFDKWKIKMSKYVFDRIRLSPDLVEALLPSSEQHVPLLVRDPPVPVGHLVERAAAELAQGGGARGLVTPDHHRGLGDRLVHARVVLDLVGAGAGGVGVLWTLVHGQETVADHLEVDQQLDAAQLGEVVVVRGLGLPILGLVGELERLPAHGDVGPGVVLGQVAHHLDLPGVGAGAEDGAEDGTVPVDLQPRHPVVAARAEDGLAGEGLGEVGLEVRLVDLELQLVEHRDCRPVLATL